MIRNRLPEIMRREGITAYRLAKALARRAARNTIYRWARGEVPTCLDVGTLEALLAGLRELTGKSYGVGDLLAYEEEVGDGAQGKR
ncbi:hypothetical protein [Thermus sp.]|uniref:hypothetical protein n=1 Tax=Thermus sp. TaxID=275 RepID=UPI003D12064C